MLKYKDRMRVEWVAKDGSIFTKLETEFKADSGFKVRTPISIGFNLGEAAEHIVNLHNESLKNVERT